MPLTAVVSSKRFTRPRTERTISVSGTLRGARGFAAGLAAGFAAAGRLAAGLRAGAGLRAVEAGLAVGEAGLRAVAGFDVGDLRAWVPRLEPAGCAPVPGSGEESTVKHYQ